MRVIIKQSLKITTTPLIAPRRQFKTQFINWICLASLNFECNWFRASVSYFLLSPNIKLKVTIQACEKQIDAPHSDVTISQIRIHVIFQTYIAKTPSISMSKKV